MERSRSINDSQLHRTMLSSGFELDKGKSKAVKLNLRFEWETDNFFRYACRMPNNKVAVVYVPKVLWGKREAEMYVGTYQYVETRSVEQVQDAVQDLFGAEFVVAKKVRRTTARKRPTKRAKK